MLRRTRALRDPVTIFLDGSPVDAERGEPLAVSLLASDVVTLARSAKLHRPRGPSCLRGACDGCLARVDGVPNVMTCLVRARGGEQIETQNVIGSRKSDLLRVTDWFFPNGLDHHHFMAGIPGVSDVMQKFARKVAGLGKLPAEVLEPAPARRMEVDAVVIGAGPAGIAVASKLRSAGLRVALVDDGTALGGSMTAVPERLSAVLEANPLGGVTILNASVAGGVYLGEVLVVTEPKTGEAKGASQGSQGGDVEAYATVITAKTKVFATGAHDGVARIPNNDMPGIFSARALLRVIAHGVSVEGGVVLAGEGFWADELEKSLGERLAARVALGDLVRAEGRSRVRTAVVKSGSRTRSIKVDAIAIATTGAPAFEVAAQAGAEARYQPGAGYVIACDERGRAGEGVWAVGECTGRALDVRAFAEEAARTADDVRRAIGA
jgi:sarcosine oxidase subunit alpha